MKKIHIIITGGTIGKIYREDNGTLSNQGPILEKRFISELRSPYRELELDFLFSKDSLDLTNEDRAQILQRIQFLSTQGNPIVVFHGTDTMDKTVQYCITHLKKASISLPVPVVFTGAMRPLEFADSDARQNVTEALFIAPRLDPGFYLSFHGELFHGAHFQKNREKGTFEAIPFS